jgi:hypothetical protein
LVRIPQVPSRCGSSTRGLPALEELVRTRSSCEHRLRAVARLASLHLRPLRRVRRPATAFMRFSLRRTCFPPRAVRPKPRTPTTDVAVARARHACTRRVVCLRTEQSASERFRRRGEVPFRARSRTERYRFPGRCPLGVRAARRFCRRIARLLQGFVPRDGRRADRKSPAARSRRVHPSRVCPPPS